MRPFWVLCPEPMVGREVRGRGLLRPLGCLGGTAVLGLGRCSRMYLEEDSRGFIDGREKKGDIRGPSKF